MEAAVLMPDLKAVTAALCATQASADTRWQWRSSFSAWLTWHLFLPRNYAEVVMAWQNKCSSVCICKTYEARHPSITWSTWVSLLIWACYFPTHLSCILIPYAYSSAFTTVSFPIFLPQAQFPCSLSSSLALISVMPASWVIGPESIPLRPLRKTSRGRGRERKRRNKSQRRWKRKEVRG